MKTVKRRIPIQAQGFSTIEALVASVLIVVVMTASAQVLAVVSRQTNRAKQQIAMQETIDADIRDMKSLARSYTCCSGVCLSQIPASTPVGGDSESDNPADEVQPCATRDSRDDRYYFPQRDLPSSSANFPNTTTPSEPLAVDQLCASNTNFMTPFKTFADQISSSRLTASGASRSTAIIGNKTLKITYRDTIGNADARVLYLRPTAADFCT